MAPGDLPTFPEKTDFHYLAEGGANIVYRISIHPRTPEQSVVEEYGDGTPPPSIIDDNPVPLWERPYEGQCTLLSFTFSSMQVNAQGPAPRCAIILSRGLSLVSFHAVLRDERFALRRTTDSPSDRLVRFRKNLPTTAPCAVAQANWERLIKPLFPEHQLVDQTLVELRSGKIIAKLNKELRGWELYDYSRKGFLCSTDPRPTKRQGIYLADDDHALLITDMTPRKCHFQASHPTCS